MNKLYAVQYTDNYGSSGQLVKLYASKAWANRKAEELKARPWCVSASVLTISF